MQLFKQTIPTPMIFRQHNLGAITKIVQRLALQELESLQAAEGLL